MNRSDSVAMRTGRFLKRTALVAAAMGGAAFTHPIVGQAPTPLARVRAYELDSVRVGRVTAFFSAAEQTRALEMAELSSAAARHFEQEFGTGFPLHLAVLRPEQWFVPYQGGDSEPYGIPWGWVPELLMTVPASLTEGGLIQGSDRVSDARRVLFVMLHEYGHLAAKRYLHPESDHLYSAVRWFEEVVATYFAYVFIAQEDPVWADEARLEWESHVEADAPASATLDWSFMLRLPPEQFASTYGWYQNLLNVRAAEVYDERGTSFLPALRDQLPWRDADEWTTESLLPLLETVSPGFEAWARALEEGKYVTPGPA